MKLQHILPLLAFGSGVGGGYVYIFSLGENIPQDGEEKADLHTGATTNRAEDFLTGQQGN
jgi:hypothetical protein